MLTDQLAMICASRGPAALSVSLVGTYSAGCCYTKVQACKVCARLEAGSTSWDVYTGISMACFAVPRFMRSNTTQETLRGDTQTCADCALQSKATVSQK